jgi:hypothetical protein
MRAREAADTAVLGAVYTALALGCGLLWILNLSTAAGRGLMRAWK